MACQRCIPWLVTMLLLGQPCLPTSHLASAAAAVILEGDVVVEGYDFAGTAQYSVTVPFRASVAGSSWWLRAIYNDRYSEECGSDDGETGSLLTFHRPAASQPGNAGLLPVLSVGRGGHPAFAEATTRVIWFAVASSGFFKEAGAAATLPVLWNSGVRSPAGHAIKLENLTYLPSTQPLPHTADFVVSSEKALVARDSGAISKSVTAEELGEIARAAAKADGFQLAHYEVTGTTQAEGILFPEEFLLTVFHPRSASLAIKQQVYRGRVKVVGTEQRFAFRPRLERPVSVRDHRFNDTLTGVEEIQYQCTSNTWPSRDDPVLLALVQQHQALNASRVRGAPFRTWGQASATLLVIALCVALPWLIRRWKRS